MFKLIENPNLVVEVQHIVRRKWGERLLSRPWTPWISNKVRVEHVPFKELELVEMLMLIEDLIIQHPKMVERFKDELVKECMPWGMIN